MPKTNLCDKHDDIDIVVEIRRSPIDAVGRGACNSTKDVCKYNNYFLPAPLPPPGMRPLWKNVKIIPETVREEGPRGEL